MSDDKKLSELITQSIRRELSEEQSTILEQHIEQNEEARKFADWSQRIHDSVVGMRIDDEPVDDDSICLSSEFRAKLQESVSAAIEEKASMSRRWPNQQLKTKPLSWWTRSRPITMNEP